MKSVKDESKSNPARMYSKPAAILSDATLTNAKKREILERWKAEAVHMQESDAEGFNGGERSHLDEITAALEQLKD
jgi:hypothetical protein